MEHKKVVIRRKAVESMLKDGPGIPIRRRDKMNDVAEEDKDIENSGMVSFMVTPEEKRMILSMRKGGRGAVAVEEAEVIEG